MKVSLPVMQELTKQAKHSYLRSWIPNEQGGWMIGIVVNLAGTSPGAALGRNSK